MIAYTTLGTKNMDKAAAFYEALFETIGAKRIFNSDSFTAWVIHEDQPMFAVVLPFNGEPATVGNGTMIGLNAESPEMIDKLHAKALELGAANEGNPGLREGGYYCAYFRDLDGNKLNFICEA